MTIMKELSGMVNVVSHQDIAGIDKEKGAIFDRGDTMIVKAVVHGYDGALIIGTFRVGLSPEDTPIAMSVDVVEKEYDIFAPDNTDTLNNLDMVDLRVFVFKKCMRMMFSPAERAFEHRRLTTAEMTKIYGRNRTYEQLSEMTFRVKEAE